MAPRSFRRGTIRLLLRRVSAPWPARLAHRHFVGFVPLPFALLAVQAERRSAAPGAVRSFAGGAPRLGLLGLGPIGLEIGHDMLSPPGAKLRPARRRASAGSRQKPANYGRSHPCGGLGGGGGTFRQ